MNEPAQALHVALARGGEHRAGAEEEEALEHRMIEDVKQRRGQRQRRRREHVVGMEGEREPEADEDDADVLDRVIGEQALEIVLHQRVQHAQDRAGAAEEQHDRAPPPGRRPHQVEHDAHEAVHRDLGHHAAHQRGHVARRRRMRERQPDVQRHEPGLGAGTEQGEREHRRGDVAGDGGALRIASNAYPPSGPAKQAKGEQQRQRAEARHQQVDVARARVAALPVVRHDQRPRGERHELPGQQERECVVGQHDEIHAGEKGGKERQHATRLRLVPPVAEAVQARRGAAQIDDGEKGR